MKKVGKVISIIISCLLLVVLLISVYNVVAKSVFKVKNPTLFGFSSAIVITGSMEGTIDIYDMIIVQNKAEYFVGDIISYRENTSTVTHRITEKNMDGTFITKGDANNSPDDKIIRQEEIVGKVVFVIPKVGKIIMFFRTPFGLMLLVFTAIAVTLVPNIIEKKFVDGGKGNVKSE